jgi:hypothetical protein
MEATDLQQYLDSQHFGRCVSFATQGVVLRVESILTALKSAHAPLFAAYERYALQERLTQEINSRVQAALTGFISKWWGVQFTEGIGILHSQKLKRIVGLHFSAPRRNENEPDDAYQVRGLRGGRVYLLDDARYLHAEEGVVAASQPEVLAAHARQAAAQEARRTEDRAIAQQQAAALQAKREHSSFQGFGRWPGQTTFQREKLLKPLEREFLYEGRATRRWQIIAAEVAKPKTQQAGLEAWVNYYRPPTVACYAILAFVAASQQQSNFAAACLYELAWWDVEKSGETDGSSLARIWHEAEVIVRKGATDTLGWEQFRERAQGHSFHLHYHPLMIEAVRLLQDAFTVEPLTTDWSDPLRVRGDAEARRRLRELVERALSFPNGLNLDHWMIFLWLGAVAEGIRLHEYVPRLQFITTITPSSGVNYANRVIAWRFNFPAHMFLSLRVELDMISATPQDWASEQIYKGLQKELAQYPKASKFREGLDWLSAKWKRPLGTWTLEVTNFDTSKQRKGNPYDNISPPNHVHIEPDASREERARALRAYLGTDGMQAPLRDLVEGILLRVHDRRPDKAMAELREQAGWVRDRLINRIVEHFHPIWGMRIGEKDKLGKYRYINRLSFEGLPTSSYERENYGEEMLRKAYLAVGQSQKNGMDLFVWRPAQTANMLRKIAEEDAWIAEREARIEVKRQEQQAKWRLLTKLPGTPEAYQILENGPVLIRADAKRQSYVILLQGMRWYAFRTAKTAIEYAIQLVAWLDAKGYDDPIQAIDNKTFDFDTVPSASRLQAAENERSDQLPPFRSHFSKEALRLIGMES